MSNYFCSTHPKNGLDVTIEYDEDFRLVDATYSDDESVDLTPHTKASLQADIDSYINS